MIQHEPRPAVPKMWLVPFSGLLATAAIIIADPDRFAPLHVTLRVVVVSGLVIALVRSLGNAERRARGLANATIEHLRDREARFRTIVDSAPESVTLASLDGRLLEVNPAALDMFEASRAEEVVGRIGADFVHPDDRAEVHREQALVAAGQQRTIRFRVVGLRGRVRWVELNGVPLRDARSGGLSILTVARDVTQRMETERLLRRTTSMLETVFHAVPDLFIVLDVDGTILEFRGGASSDLDALPASLLGRRFEEVLPPSMSDAITTGLTRVQTTGQPAAIEYALSTASGADTFEARFLPLGTDQVVMVARNITEQKQADTIRRTTEEQYRRIVETAAEGIWTLDATALTTFVNERMAQLLDYSPAEMIGRSVFDFTDEAGGTIVTDFFARGRAGVAVEHEFSFRRRDGSRMAALVSGKPIFGADGELTGALGMITDITDRRAVETLMRSIVENSPNMIFVKDAEHLRYVLCNRAGEALLGLGRDGAVGKSDYDLFLKEEADFFTAKDRQVLAGGGTLVIEQEPLQTPDQGLRYLRTAKVPIMDAAGRPQYLLGIAEDITERLRMEDDRRQSQKLEAVGTLASGIAHDFNNILASVIGFSELARMDSGDNPHVLKNIDNVLEAGERAKGLVEQIMAFTRQQEYDLHPLAPAAAVASAINLVRAALPTTVSIVANLPDGLPMILADATQIHRLVMNLLTNGAQAMDAAGGQLTIVLAQVHVTDELAAPQRELFPGDYVRLSVTDTGTGMDTATLARIFEPFFTTKPPGGGTGLGLSVVHGIVRSHAGAILVESEPGRGTTFHIYFPSHHGAVTAAAVEAPAVPQGNGQHILLIDDEAPLVEAHRELLERLGYRVTGVSDPVAAVSLFRTHPEDFDLVVTDLLMPMLNGTELAQQLLRIRPGVPILLNTGFAGRVTPEAARTMGIYGVLLKPMSVGGLARAVHGAITRTPPPFPHQPGLLP